MPSENQTTDAPLRFIEPDEARLGFTHIPTGHRVEIKGDYRSIEIVRELIFKALGAKEVSRG